MGQSVLVTNYGISLSLNPSNALLLNIIFILLLGWWFFKSDFKSLVFILWGGIINFIDRCFFGYVRDYWSLGGDLFNNLNDWLIGFGVLLFLIESLCKRQK